MTIALSGHGEAANWTATPGTTLSTAAFVVNAGDTIVVVQNSIASGAFLSDTAGNSYTQVPGTVVFWVAINAKPSAANVVTATFGSAEFTYIAANSFSGCDPVNPLDTSAWTPFGSQPAVQNPASPFISTRWPVEVLIGWVQSADTLVGVGSGYTQISNPGSPSTTAQLVEYQLVSSVQTNVQATATETTLANWGMGIIALVGAGQRPGALGDLGPGYDFKFRL